MLITIDQHQSQYTDDKPEDDVDQAVDVDCSILGQVEQVPYLRHGQSDKPQRANLAKIDLSVRLRSRFKDSFFMGFPN